MTAIVVYDPPYGWVGPDNPEVGAIKFTGFMSVSDKPKHIHVYYATKTDFRFSTCRKTLEGLRALRGNYG